jgi:hypothetical protein
MKQARECLGIAAALLSVYTLVLAAQPSLPVPSCQSTLSGADFPHLVPEFLAWQALLGELHRDGKQHLIVNDITLGADGYSLVVERTAALRTQLASLRSKHADREARIRDAEVADAIIDARDDLIRSLPIESYRSLKTAVEAARRGSFNLAAPGRTIGLISSGSGCRVTVRGRDYPHLIRDKFAWRFYFQTIAGAAKNFRRGPNDYDPRHIAAVRSSQPIPLPWQYITQLLETATQVVADIERLPNTADADAIGDAIAEDARDQLIRSLPRPIWLAVKADESRSRAGTIIAFPPSR